MQARTSSLAMLFLLAVALWSADPCQAAVIKGTVTDSLTSAAVPAAVVKIKGTTDSTLSDTAGRFTLNTTVGIGRAVSIMNEKIPSNVLVTVYRPDGTILRSARVPELSALPDGMYLLAYQENGSTRAGKLVKFGTQYQTGPQQAGKAAANVTLVCTKYYCRTMELVAAEGDTSVRVRLVLKKGWELDSTNVGLAPLGIVGSQLPLYTGPVDGSTGNYKPPAGSRISGKRFDAPVELSLGNIIIEKSLFQPTWIGTVGTMVNTVDYNQFIPVPSKVIIRDCEFDGSQMTPRDGWSLERTMAGALAFHGVADVQRCYIHNVGSGLALRYAGNQFDCLFEQNCVTHLIGWGDPGTTGSHNNACTIRDFTDAARPGRVGIVRNNRLELNTPNNASSSLQVSGTDGLTANITAEGNIFEGYGYQVWLVHAGNGFKNCKAINNRWRSMSGWYSYSDDPGWVVWQDNYRYDPTKTEARGVMVNQ